MGENDVSSSVASNLTNVMTDYSVDTRTLDNAGDQKETRWQNTKWTQYHGYYKSIPELRAVIDAKANWTVGKGYETDPITELILMRIKGNGFDTFNTIIENAVRTYQIGGDSYAEIITDDRGFLINLKPLDPENIVHIANKSGRIIAFEQTSKIKGKKPRRFKPEEIFYLPRNRLADEIHGTSMTEALEWIILAKNEAMADQKITFHRFVKPRWIIKLDTDKPAKIATAKAKWDKANDGGENMYVPMGSVEVEQMAISPNSTLNPNAWMEILDAKFYEAANCPKVIVGGAGGFTDAAVKIAYLAFETNIKAEKLFVEEQILSQLNLSLQFKSAASLENGMLSDEAKDGTVQQQTNQPAEMAPTQAGEAL